MPDFPKPPESSKSVVVIPADYPRQISDSPRLELLQQSAEVRLYTNRASSREELLARVADADVILNSRNQVHWPGELMRQLPRLKMISTGGIGTDSIDLEAASELGIVVSNIPGKTAGVVAEHALALLFAAARRVGFLTSQLKSGRWTAIDNIYLRGKTLGVIGTGSIGAEMARLAQAVGMKVIAWTFNPSPARAAALGLEYVELDDLLSRSDAISLHVKLTSESRGLIGSRELSLMKPGSLLVNTARGAVVDNVALVEALDSGHLAGAGLDVFDIEPLPANDPILSCQQVVLTPHSADQNPEGMDLLNLGAVENVLAFLRGEPQNVVT